MCKTTISGNGALGSIPGGGSTENETKPEGYRVPTEQCSVEIAKVLPRVGDTVEVQVCGGGWHPRTVVSVSRVVLGAGNDDFRVECMDHNFGLSDADWRWPVSDAGDLKVVQEVVVHQRLRRTGGRNGTPEPGVIPEEHEQPNDKQPVATWEGDVGLLGIPPHSATTTCARKGCDRPVDVRYRTVFCEGHLLLGHDGQPADLVVSGPEGQTEWSARTTCRVCGDFTPCGCGTVRICKGIPIAQGPDEACTCALGPGLERCVVCADWMQRCGRCDGCCGHLPGWTVTGYLCKECRESRLRLITRRRPEGLAERIRAILEDAEGRAWRAVAETHDPRSAQAILADATERAWQALAESPDLDPLTVGVCKRLRDMECGS